MTKIIFIRIPPHEWIPAFVVYFCLILHLLKYLCHILLPNFSLRFKLLESQLSQLELFDQALLTLTQRSENLLSVLRSSSQVDIVDLEAAILMLEVRN